METTVLMPERNGTAQPDLSIRMRTGMRCTTLTQLPLPFSDGSAEKLESLPALSDSTWPC